MPQWPGHCGQQQAGEVMAESCPLLQVKTQLPACRLFREQAPEAWLQLLVAAFYKQPAVER